MAGRPDPAVAAVRLAVRRCGADLEPGARVVVACSGGADSMALAAAAVFEGRAAGWLVGAATVDHGLQAESAQVAAEVARRLVGIGCDPARVLRVQVGDGGGPEAAARTARYLALEQLAASDDVVVLLGHTRDDQAESVLLGLARGSGTRSLSGMAASRGPFRRPLLRLTRAETLQACAAQGLEVWSDPHNTDEQFSRVRVRDRVLPVLERELGPGVAEALARTAALARADADALDTFAAELAARASAGPGALDVTVLEPTPDALRTRVLRIAALAAGCPAGDLTAGHVEALDALVTHWRGQRHLDLPGHVRASRRDTIVTFSAR